MSGIAASIVPFVILLGVLIFIHELGHFLVAKWFNVRVDKFSLGFGPSLLARKVGETEYVLAALPLGGFVKMLGEVPGEELPAEDRDRAFNTKPIWQRIAISLAGPAMNFVLPVLLLGGLLFAGLPTATSRLGDVEPDSPAERAGLLRGDRITAVNGQTLWRAIDVRDALALDADANVKLEIERAGATLPISIEREKDESGRFLPIGIDFLSPASVVRVTDPASPAAHAGVQTLDRVLRVGDKETATFSDLQRALVDAKAPIELELERPVADGASARVIATVREAPSARDLASFGLAPVELSVAHLTPSAPAKEAGLLEGDVVIAIDGVPLSDRSALIEKVRSSDGKALRIELWRAGATRELEITPRRMPIEGENGIETHWAIGAGFTMPSGAPELRDDVVRNPFVALARGAELTWHMTRVITSGIAQLFMGRMGMDTLSGPIGIGKLAADRFSVSWMEFVELMAAISVNLAILNLLPIPILDGGQIVFALAEGAKGSPLSLRAREVAQTVGLSLLLLLMGVAFWNDLSPHMSGFLNFFTQLG